MGRIMTDDRCLIRVYEQRKNGGLPNKRSSVASMNHLTKKVTTAGQLNGSQAVAVPGL